MATIVSIKARQIFDSRGNPTLEVDLTCSDGTFVRAAVPSGASTGNYEDLELRDGGPDYLGKGVSEAVYNVNCIIGPQLTGKDPTKQTDIDSLMVEQLDGTSNKWGWCKQKPGANAILAVSLAVCKAGASVQKIPLYKHIANLAGNKKLVLPVPFFNVINGGSHAGNKLSMQEFMILPVGASSFKEAMKIGAEVYCCLKAVIQNKYGQVALNVGAEGGFAPDIQENKEGLELLKTAIAEAGYTGKVVIAITVAASEFYEDDKTYDLNFKEDNNNGSQKISGDAFKDLYKSSAFKYPVVSIEDLFDQDVFAKLTGEVGANVQIVGNDLLVTNPKNNDGSQKISGGALKDLYKSFVFEYPVVSIEDPYDQDGWEHFAKLTGEVGANVQIVGDDLLVTNSKNNDGSQKISGDASKDLYKSFVFEAYIALLITVNQIRSVTEIIKAVKMSKRAGWGVMASHRSGETEDTFIADLSVGLATGQIKTGAPCRSECLAKYNQLLRIEEELGAEAVYAGANFRPPVEHY